MPAFTSACVSVCVRVKVQVPDGLTDAHGAVPPVLPGAVSVSESETTREVSVVVPLFVAVTVNVTRSPASCRPDALVSEMEPTVVATATALTRLMVAVIESVSLVAPSGAVPDV